MITPQFQQTPQTMGVPQQPLIGGKDPQSAYLQQALQAMDELGRTGRMGNATGLAGNLMADALLQYGLQQRQKQLAQQQSTATAAQPPPTPWPTGPDSSMSALPRATIAGLAPYGAGAALPGDLPSQ